MEVIRKMTRKRQFTEKVGLGTGDETMEGISKRKRTYSVFTLVCQTFKNSDRRPASPSVDRDDLGQR